MIAETLILSRCIRYHPAWTQHYHEFHTDIAKGFSCPHHSLVYQCLKTTPPCSEPQHTLEHCLEKALLLAKTLPAISSAALLQLGAKLQDTFARPANAADDETTFRSWLQKVITTAALATEPRFANGQPLNDPINDAAKQIGQLQTLPLASQTQEQPLQFPLSDVSLSRRPQIALGIDVFDQCELQGGPEYDTLLTLSGETNVGKTRLGLYLLGAILAQRKTVLLISGEDSPEENKCRILCHFLKVSRSTLWELTETQRHQRMTHFYGDAQDPNSLHHHLRTRFASACPREGELTPKFIQTQIEKTQQHLCAKVDAIMVDYLQKAQPDGLTPRMARDEALELFVNQLKNMGENRHFTLLISQVPSWAAGGKHSQFLSAREAVARSYAATWGAHYIITMNRPQKEIDRLQKDPDKRARLNLFLCKSKHGPIGTCHALADKNWKFFRTPEELERFTAFNPQPLAQDID